MEIAPYVDKLGVRSKGFSVIFELLQAGFEKQGPLILVETGCVRQLDNWLGDGSSTVLFNQFAKTTGSQFYTIDINPDHCRLAQQTCPDATVLCGDSIALLYQLRKSLSHVDFLYLDSFDLDWNNPH